ncbi:hypothetical protein [Pararhodospirillum oryzae]|uniref:Uncharacterized protein n=1 Tax=Pararhodospirillum oryzae TaxID=478448 RepID=A0A512H8W1_9PROT|nr:hypothetical protein [Pararhodospirillum oryzae]GEO81896.1 hypothetical protein ROR02_20270 [Pararhodospirillum oryzae]
MRFLIRILLAVVVLGVATLGVVLASLDTAPPTRTIIKVIPNDRY